jgi:Nucleotide modification associated domain 1
MQNTSLQYNAAIDTCRTLFEKKMRDYGCAWRVLRPSSITDQIFIKANRIRSIQEKGTQKIGDNIADEFIGIINYAIIGLIQLELGYSQTDDLQPDHCLKLYNKYAFQTKQLMEDKNHDYGEAWRDMRISSLTDLILMKLYRTKQIEDNNGATIVSEGIDANYMDMLNYAVFAMILMQEQMPIQN